ncbi:MAG: endopeptidase La [Deltaproteobacteria bacterium]|nr:endopeptidase La [Deltaproteobacteria bacterium]
MKEELRDTEEPGAPDEKHLEPAIPKILPLLPIRDMVVFPSMIVPLIVGREKSINALDEALKRDRLIFLSSQREGENENPSPDEISITGTVSVIVRMIKTPDEKVKILVQGLQRGRVEEFLKTEPFFSVRLDLIKEISLDAVPVKVEALARALKEGMARMVQLGKLIPPDVLAVAENINDPGRLADLAGSSIGLDLNEAQMALEMEDPNERLVFVHKVLRRELKVLEMQQRIQDQTKEEMTKTQREYFLRQQLKTIQAELGEKGDRETESEEFQDKIEKAQMPPEVRKEVEKQLERLSKMHPDSAEAAIIRTYLEWMVELPWKRSTRDRLDLKKAQKVLDDDHYDLEKVKERILEYLGVLKLRKGLKGPILCFVGPPGVGKTSLGRSIARAMGRNFVRMSLGGMRDEAEIRGHRRTYVGALPGRIIQGIKQAGSRNPVFMLDEIDKLGSDFRGDPSSALLEVLDPEQNHAFRDHYLAVPYDLSPVMFIATANMTDPVPSALLDRMEVIRLAGYTAVDKRHIARRYLISRQMERNGINEDFLSISNGALDHLILKYTREAGVRNLEREIGNLCRKAAKKVAMGKTARTRITAGNISAYLGPPRHFGTKERGEPQVGVVMGLAWTPVGGDILYIEVAAVKGKGILTLTGSLGNVMKESAQAALSFIRSHGRELGIEPENAAKFDFHVHVPAGAIPKDGPSAGIAITTAIVSALSGVPPGPDLAMTGEVTLTGRVLPIGGLKEKLLAAKRAQVKRVVIPEGNSPDLEEIPSYILRSMEIIPVGDVGQVLEAASLKPVKIKGRASMAGKSSGKKEKS